MPRPDIPSSSLFGTAFSFLLVLVITVFMAFTSVRTYVLYGNYTGLTDHFNTIGVIFLIFWIVVISLILRLLHPLLGLSPANFALIYAALMVAVVLPSMGFGGYFIPLIAGAFYYATPENNWSDLLWPHIPHWRRHATSNRFANSSRAPTPARRCPGICGPVRCCGGACLCWPSSSSASP